MIGSNGTTSDHGSQHAPNMLRVSPDDRRAIRLGWTPLLRNKLREILVKLRGKRIYGQGMIGADAAAVREGFDALASNGFDTYNLPQVWVESRQIPTVIDGRVPARHALVLDLGCGPGTSTRVLSYFADPTWTILGFDLTERSILMARQRATNNAFKNRRGDVIRPEFYCQDIAEPLLRDGRPLADASADLAMSGGVVGLYMKPERVERLADELKRVLKPGAIAALDCGPSVPRKVLARIMEARGFEPLGRAVSFVIEPRPKLVYRRPGTAVMAAEVPIVSVVAGAMAGVAATNGRGSGR
jgi:SAM-dependent methyltransferase